MFEQNNYKGIPPRPPIKLPFWTILRMPLFLWSIIGIFSAPVFYFTAGGLAGGLDLWSKSFCLFMFLSGWMAFFLLKYTKKRDLEDLYCPVCKEHIDYQFLTDSDLEKLALKQCPKCRNKLCRKTI